MDKAETSTEVSKLSFTPNRLLQQLPAAAAQDDPTTAKDEKSLVLRVIPNLVNLLHSEDKQHGAALALTNIAVESSLAVHTIISHGAVEPLIKLLSSEDPSTMDHALTALGNIAADCPEYRDTVLNFGIMPPLLQILLNNELDVILTRSAVWVLSNLCRGNPFPNIEMVSPCLPVLAKLIYSEDAEVLADTCWTVLYYCDAADDRIQQVIDAGLCERLLELIRHPDKTVVTPALRSIGYIVSGNEAQTQTIINLSILPALQKFLCSSDNDLIHASCWVLSNITAGNEEQIQAVIDSNIFPLLLTVIAKATSLEILCEAARAVLNATLHGTHQQISYLVDIGSIKQLCHLLTIDNSRVIEIALTGLENILKSREQQNAADNPYAMLMKEANSLDRLKLLQSHELKESTLLCVASLRSTSMKPKRRVDRSYSLLLKKNRLRARAYRNSALAKS